MTPITFEPRPYSFRNAPWGENAIRVLQAALGEANPAMLVQRALQREGNNLSIQSTEGEAHHFDLDNYRRVLVVATGKAAGPMAEAAAGILEGHLTQGLIITGEALVDKAPEGLQFLEASHPIPDVRSMRASTRVAALLSQADDRDIILCLLSGGASAYLTSPAEGISLSDIRRTTLLLQGAGAAIGELNTIRKHLETLKGGGLAMLAGHTRLVTLAISDVVGDHLDQIASGPTVGDPTTFSDAIDVLSRYRLRTEIPPAILKRLEAGARGDLEETPKPGSAVFDNTTTIIIGNNQVAAQAAVNEALHLGFHATLLTTSLEGEARQAGAFLSSILRQAALHGQPLPRPACIVAGGETTVTVRGGGKGGRNQELALAAAISIAGLEGAALAAMATDGVDGPTDAAGAVTTGETMERARRQGLDAEDYLDRNDAYRFFTTLGDLLWTGPTQTNVRDLTFLFTVPLSNARSKQAV